MVRVYNLETAKFGWKQMEVFCTDEGLESFSFIVDTPKGTYQRGHFTTDFAWDLAGQVVKESEKAIPYALADREVIFDKLLRQF